MPKHQNVKIWEKYEIKDGKLIRKFKLCPKCKEGILAETKNRAFCGKCGYSEFYKVVND